jgi:hypothetical protein
MVKTHGTFPFDLVIMLGDNIYGGQSPSDYVKKFEQPYGPLLQAGVKFRRRSATTIARIRSPTSRIT